MKSKLLSVLLGTIKRVWGYYYTNLKGLIKVNGEWSLIMTIYNIKRSLNILGFEEIMEKLNDWKPDYSKIKLCLQKTDSITCFIRILFFEMKVAA
jgi:hypothetical protein